MESWHGQVGGHGEWLEGLSKVASRVGETGPSKIVEMLQKVGVVVHSYVSKAEFVGGGGLCRVLGAREDIVAFFVL